MLLCAGGVRGVQQCARARGPGVGRGAAARVGCARAVRRHAGRLGRARAQRRHTLRR